MPRAQLAERSAGSRGVDTETRLKPRGSSLRVEDDLRLRRWRRSPSTVRSRGGPSGPNAGLAIVAVRSDDVEGAAEDDEWRKGRAEGAGDGAD